MAPKPALSSGHLPRPAVITAGAARGAGGITVAGDAHQVLTVVIVGYAIIETKIIVGNNPGLRRALVRVFSRQPVVQV